MRPLQILGQEVQMLDRRADFAVPENDRQPHHVPAGAQVLGRERLAQQIEATLRETRGFNRQD